ncbi:MAG: response regulator [Chloroflexi bacterium]|nr:response regulator [Chloroflexota bacterium]MDA1217949.1 response regulator [Chloroflexota bacterium]
MTATKPTPLSPPSLNHQGVKILLIEDDPDDAYLFMDSLSGIQGNDWSVKWAKTLADGLKIAECEMVDLVLLDLSLPDSLGIETLLKAYGGFPSVPIILLTGLDDEETVN